MVYDGRLFSAVAAEIEREVLFSIHYKGNNSQVIDSISIGPCMEKTFRDLIREEIKLERQGVLQPSSER